MLTHDQIHEELYGPRAMFEWLRIEEELVELGLLGDPTASSYLKSTLATEREVVQRLREREGEPQRQLTDGSSVKLLTASPRRLASSIELDPAELREKAAPS